MRPRLDVSGADRLVVDATRALQGHGWHAEVAVNFFNPAWTQPEVTSGQVGVTAFGGIAPGWTGGRMRALSALVSQWLLLRRLRRHGPAPDLFVCDILPHAAAAIRRWFPESAVLVYCHFPDRRSVAARGPYGIYRSAIGCQEDRGMMAAHRVLANSGYTADAVRQTFPFLPADRIAIVRPGVRLPPVSNHGASRSGATAPKRTILSVARFDPLKGLPLAIEAFAAFRDRVGATEFASWRLVLAGGYDRSLPEVHALVEQLRAEASARGVGDQVELRFDPSPEALEALWREAFALVHCAPAEHFGIVLIEAMARGLPVLAVDYGGPRETVVEGITGALRAPKAEEFAGVLARWSRDPAHAAGLGAAGRARAEAEFSIDRFSADFAAQAELASRCSRSGLRCISQPASVGNCSADSVKPRPLTTMSANPVVSVIMPCWNRERFVADAIRSVLAQTLADFELIVVDDGSTDGTREVVASFSDPRLRCLHREHRGISAAMNAGLGAAKGHYIARLDSDDMWLPEMLETQVGVLEARPEIGLVYSRAECTDSAWRPLSMSWGYPLRYPGETFRSMVYNDCTCNITVVCRRECFERVGNYDETLETSEDLDLWLRVARHYQFAFTDRVLARVRLHGDSITGGISDRRDEQMERRGVVFDKLFATPGLPAEIVAMQGLVYSNLHTSNGLLWLGHGKKRKALHAFRRAVAVSSSPPYTLARIGWSCVKWHVLPRLPAGRRLAAWMEAARARKAR